MFVLCYQMHWIELQQVNTPFCLIFSLFLRTRKITIFLLLTITSKKVVTCINLIKKKVVKNTRIFMFILQFSSSDPKFK